MSVIKAVDVAYVRFAVPDMAKQRAFLADFGMVEVGEIEGNGFRHAPPSHRRTSDRLAPRCRRAARGNGVLSRRSSGTLCIKSFSGMRSLSDDGAVDIIDIDDLPSWSEKATELSERLIALGGGLRYPSAPS